jgi:hypothetical protein
MRTNHAMQEPIVTGPLKRECDGAWTYLGGAEVVFRRAWVRHLIDAVLTAFHNVVQDR